ncbi:MAG: uncharacterized protein QOJ11_595 [Frankiales bacterium]|nr:uncharacterized protein [Frankiales bacterium]
MHIDPYLVLAGLVVGSIVGLTGMGGGALMTPILVLLFHIQPLAAISSDLVASVVMKPFGSAVHLKHGTVHRGVVRWLAMGSIPGALAGVLISTSLRHASHVQNELKIALGIALLLAVAGITARAVIDRRRHVAEALTPAEVPVRRLPTLLVGVGGGVVVGLTSVGSGSLMIVLLMMLYPRLSTRQLVGTDLVQAVPLVAAAALGQLLLGDVKLPLTGALLLGAIPGVIFGAKMSAIAPSGPLRWALAVVLSGSGVKLLGAGNGVLLAVIVVGLAIGAGLLELNRRTRTAAPVVTAPALERV